MSRIFLEISEGFLINSNFHAIHSQSLDMDLLFFVVVILYLFFLLFTIPESISIINHPAKIESDIKGVPFKVKTSTLLWAKVLVLMSIPIVSSMLSSYYSFSRIGMLLLVLLLFCVMFLKWLSYTIISTISDRSAEIKLIRYTSDCRLVIFTTVYIAAIFFSYSLSILPFFPLVFVALYFILHIIRTIKLLKEAEFSFFDIFLYLCPLELLPLVIAVLSVLKIMG